MINDRTVFRLCMIIGLCGTASIFLIAYLTSPLDVRIGEINEKMIGRNVRINGEISAVASGENTFISLSDKTGEIKAVYFGKTKVTGNATITGKVEVYKGRMEIVVSEIK